jgi:hypothetical protein
MKTFFGLLETIRTGIATLFTPRTPNTSNETLEAKLLLFVQD